MIKILILVLIAEALAGAGQILLKKSANKLGSHDLKKIGSHLPFLGEIFSKPALWVGFILMTLGLLSWLAALAEGDLSLVYPLGSSQYILILFLAHFMLGEKIDRMKFVGTLLVVLGIVLITITH